MRSLRILAILGAALVLALAAGKPARADDAAVGAVGSTVAPLSNTQVRMAAEQVDAEIRDLQGWVTCVFTFTNSGPAAEVLMGFPELRPGDVGGAPQLLDFTAQVDGTAAPVTFRPQAPDLPGGETYAGWHTFTVPFAAGQTRVVRNTYHGPLTAYSNGDYAFTYVLHTGAGWAGTIGEAGVTVQWAPGTLRTADVPPQPPGGQTGAGRVHWQFTDLEPAADDDIAVYVRPDASPTPEPTPGMPRTGQGPAGPPLPLLALAGAALALAGWAGRRRAVRHRR